MIRSPSSSHSLQFNYVQNFCWSWASSLWWSLPFCMAWSSTIERIKENSFYPLSTRQTNCVGWLIWAAVWNQLCEVRAPANSNIDASTPEYVTTWYLIPVPESRMSRDILNVLSTLWPSKLCYFVPEYVFWVLTILNNLGDTSLWKEQQLFRTATRQHTPQSLPWM